MANSVNSTLLPREHGAYALLGIAVLAGLFLGHPEARCVFQTALTAVTFLASEPLMVVLGRRMENQTRRAWIRLALLGIPGAAAGWLAWKDAPVDPFRVLAVPATLAAILFGFFLLKREHTPWGEWVTAWTMASAAYPLAILGGVSPSRALALMVLVGGVLSVGMTVVRDHLRASRRDRSCWPRAQAARLGTIFLTATLLLARDGRLTWLAAFAGLPMTLVAIILGLRPERNLKRLGWTLTVASALSAALAVTGLR